MRSIVSLAGVFYAVLHVRHITPTHIPLSRTRLNLFNSGDSGYTAMPRLISYRDLMKVIYGLNPGDQKPLFTC
jgi:hypothetical protein